MHPLLVVFLTCGTQIGQIKRLCVCMCVCMCACERKCGVHCAFIHGGSNTNKALLCLRIGRLNT